MNTCFDRLNTDKLTHKSARDQILTGGNSKNKVTGSIKPYKFEPGIGGTDLFLNNNLETDLLM